ncbi:MAG: hypothetical protein FJ276_13375 [Planctomycetes bacterium]|nr:hypothetical protein [Planctomycetota bacterium]
MRVRDDLEAGRIPQPPDGDRLTLLRAVNAFLTHKKHQVETGELSGRSFGLYYTTCEQLLRHLGKTVFVEQIRPDDLLRYRRRMAGELHADGQCLRSCRQIANHLGLPEQNKDTHWAAP